MNKIVSDLGFRSLDNIIIYENWSNFSASATSIDLPPDADLSLFKGNLNKFKIIRIDFPTFADGRGFTLAKLIRTRGFTGHLRAKGHIISDQYAMLRRSGFDDVEISQNLSLLVAHQLITNIQNEVDEDLFGWVHPVPGLS